MEFLGIGPLELLFVVLIALIVIGPRDMAKTARTIGRFLNRMYKSEGWRSFLQASRTLRNLPNRLAREAELEELEQVKKDMSEARRAMEAEVRGLEKGLQAWTAPAIEEGPSTPSAAPAPPAEAKPPSPQE
jgi:sec-independent protein translocase protein TatB